MVKQINNNNNKKRNHNRNLKCTTRKTQQSLSDRVVPFFFVLFQTEGGIVVALGNKQSLKMRRAIEQALIVRVGVHSGTEKRKKKNDKNHRNVTLRRYASF